MLLTCPHRLRLHPESYSGGGGEHEGIEPEDGMNAMGSSGSLQG